MGKHSSHRMSMKYAILGLVVLAAAASAQTYASSSSYTSGYASATTSGAVTITQQVTLSITAAQYTGNVKPSWRLLTESPSASTPRPAPLASRLGAVCRPP